MFTFSCSGAFVLWISGSLSQRCTLPDLWSTSLLTLSSPTKVGRISHQEINRKCPRIPLQRQPRAKCTVGSQGEALFCERGTPVP